MATVANPKPPRPVDNESTPEPKLRADIGALLSAGTVLSDGLAILPRLSCSIQKSPIWIRNLHLIRNNHEPTPP
jgi:hypothetical protein